MSDTETLPILPIKNTVLFPYLVMPVAVGRPASVAAIEVALASEEKVLAVFAQRNADVDQPGQQELFTVGTKAVIKQMGRGEGGIQLILQGMERVKLAAVPETSPYLKAELKSLPVPTENGTEVKALERELIELGSKLQELAIPVPQIDFAQMAAQLDDPMQLVYLLGTITGLNLEKAQSLLEASTRTQAMQLLLTDLRHEIQVRELQSKIASQAHEEISREKREYLLRQQLKAISPLKNARLRDS